MPVFFEAGGSNSFESPETLPTSRRQRRLGERALINGFMLLDEAAKSPNEYIREGLKERVIGQDDAINAIVDALDRVEVRLDGDNRPVANLAFLGQTGVGKSELAKTLADIQGGNLIKIDCSAYSNGHEVANLQGSPLGYVDNKTEPILSKKSVEKSGTVVLFDEVEKGSPELYNLMLQIMGDGELSMRDGKVVSFRETTIILTSNLGAREVSNRLNPNRLGFGDPNGAIDKKGLEKIATKSFVDYFSPEFVNRLNKMVVFGSLDHEGLIQVLDSKMARISQEYEEAFGVRLTLSDATKERLVEISATESHLGARPLVRALENNIQAEFGRYVGLRKIPEGTHAHVFHESDVPEAYPRGDDREFYFALKRDRSLLPQEEPSREMVQFSDSADALVSNLLTGPVEENGEPKKDYDYSFEHDPRLSVPPLFSPADPRPRRPARPFIRIRPTDRPQQP